MPTKKKETKQQELKKTTLEEWLAEGKRLFSEDMTKWKFKCCNCGHIQSIEDFIELRKQGILAPDVDVGKLVYYSCIGRYDTRIPKEKVGTIFDKNTPCNYTLGGFFCFANVFVIGEDGKENPVFDFVREE